MSGSSAKSTGLRAEIIRASEEAPVDPVRFLIHAACTDTYHDFHKKSGFSSQVRKGESNNPSVYDARIGLNVPAEYATIPQNREHKIGGAPDINSLHEEDELMIEIFRHVEIPEQGRVVNQDNIIKSLIAYLEQSEDGMLSGQNFDGLWEKVLTPSPKTVVKTNNYNIKLFRSGAERESDISKLWSDKTMTATTTVDEISEFFGGNDIYLVFDASVINVMTFIQCTPRGDTPLSVHRIFNRESCNDPAGHTYEDKKIPNQSVKSDIYFDYDFDNISYKRHMPITYNESGIGIIEGSAPVQRDKLFSQYDFNLSPLDWNNTGAPRISLELQDEKGTRVHQSADPRMDNNIARCWKRLLECYKKDPAKHINSAAHVHCKRSGDWLQALSCLDTGRSYNNAPVSVGADRTANTAVSVDGQNLILVTHDRVLLTYALTLGIDVIMTYNWSEKASDPAGSNDEEGETGASIDDGSRKYMLYFRNSKNDSEEAKRKVLLRQIAAADRSYALEASGENIKYITAYNQWVDIIRASTLNTIKTAETATEKASSFVLLGKAITDLLKAYIRFTSIDYAKLEAGDYIYRRDTYNKLRKTYAGDWDGAKITAASNDQIRTLAALAAKYNAQISLIVCRKIRIPTLDALVAANNAYKNNPMYASPVTLTSIITTSRKSTESSQVTLMLETVSFLAPRLPPDMYQTAIDTFNKIRESKSDMFLAGKQYLYDIFLPNFISAAPSAAFAPPAAAATSFNSGAIDEEVTVYNELKAELEDADEPDESDVPLTKPDDAVVVGDLNTDERVAEGSDAKAAAAAGQAIAPSSERTRKLASVFTSISATIKSYAKSFMGWAAGGGGAQAGGGNGESDAIVSAKFLVKLYLRELYYSLYAFESEGNFDYDYYKTIAVIAVVVSKLYAGDWVKQQAFFYDELPKMDFTDIYPSDKQACLRFNLQLALGSLTARTVGLPPGPVPSMGFTGIGAIPLAECLAYAKQLRPLAFEEQRDTLIEACKAAILFGSAAGPVASAAPAVNMAALNRNRRSRKAAANAAAAASAARGRTLGTGEIVSDPAFTMPAALTVPATPGSPATLGPGPATLGYEMVAPVMSRGGDRRRRRTKRRVRRAAYSYKARAARRYTRRR